MGLVNQIGHSWQVRAALDLGARLLLPVHWGTYNVAFHAWNDPPKRAVAAAQKVGVAIVVPRPGEIAGAAQPALSHASCDP